MPTSFLQHWCAIAQINNSYKHKTDDYKQHKCNKYPTNLNTKNKLKPKTNYPILKFIIKLIIINAISFTPNINPHPTNNKAIPSKTILFTPNNNPNSHPTNNNLIKTTNL